MGNESSASYFTSIRQRHLSRQFLSSEAASSGSGGVVSVGSVKSGVGSVKSGVGMEERNGTGNAPEPRRGFSNGNNFSKISLFLFFSSSEIFSSFFEFSSLFPSVFPFPPRESFFKHSFSFFLFLTTFFLFFFLNSRARFCGEKIEKKEREFQKKFPFQLKSESN